MESSKNTVIIRAVPKANDYVGRGLLEIGYTMIPPYKGTTYVSRAARELSFGLRFINDEVWFEKRIEQDNKPNIVVFDPLITENYLKWLRSLLPQKHIVFQYNNLVVSKARHLPPDRVKPYVDVVRTYDLSDSRKYDIELFLPKFNRVYQFAQRMKKDSEYDIVFLGRDKGRADIIKKYEDDFNRIGLRTYFHICADRKFIIKKKPYYKEEMEYTDYIELLKTTRAHMNIVPDSQVSPSQRDLESVFNQVKCITNNKHIKESELYHPSRFFILGEDKLENILEFLDKPFIPVEDQILDKYTLI